MSQQEAAPTFFRRDFLQGLFRRLNDAKIRYCILRNYDNIYDDNSSDVDVMVDPSNLQLVEELMGATLHETGGSLIRRAEFVCHAFIFYGGGQLFHIDLEYCKRWRIFPIVSVEDVLGRVQRYGEFYVPAPEHEALILWAQCFSASVLSERYRESLSRLFQRSDKGVLGEVYRNAFGELGAWLLEVHKNLEKETCDRAFFSKIRRSLMKQALKYPERIRESLRFIGWDLKRIVSRVTTIPGLQCHFITGGEALAADSLLRELTVLFPPSKARVRLRNESEAPLFQQFRQKWSDFKLLFRGGILLEVDYAVSDGVISEIAARVGAKRRWINYPRVTVLDYQSEGLLAINGSTGFGQKLSDRQEIGRFLIQTVGGNSGWRGRDTSRRGAVCVLLGLDGSGKTSVARALCLDRGKVMERFAGVRYLHWIPKPWSSFSFPLPTFGNIPRRKPDSLSIVSAFLSGIRLLKNLLSARLAFAFCLRPLVARGDLVLLDRYYYNYWIDPDSVRYTGPKWFLRMLEPLFPKPDLVLIFWAEGEVLLQRKQEISADQIAIQLQELARIAKTPRAKVIDAGQNLPHVVECSIRALLNDFLK